MTEPVAKMSEYIPTTGEVRARNGLIGEFFDRWLAAHDADVWQAGFESGERDVYEHERDGDWDADCIPNSYREATE